MKWFSTYFSISFMDFDKVIFNGVSNLPVSFRMKFDNSGLIQLLGHIVISNTFKYIFFLMFLWGYFELSEYAHSQNFCKHFENLLWAPQCYQKFSFSNKLMRYPFKLVLNITSKWENVNWLLVQLIKTFITVHLLKDLNFEMKFYEDVSRDERLDGTWLDWGGLGSAQGEVGLG